MEINIEEIKAALFNAEALREPAYRIYQLNTAGYRYYYRLDANGRPEFYPSVTTILRQTLPTSPQLLEWMLKNGKDGAEDKRDTAAAYGTFMHIQFEKLLIDRAYDFDAVPAAMLAYMEENKLSEKFFTENIDKVKKDVCAFAQFVNDYQVRPLAVEIGLVSETGHYAGCVDMVCMMTDPKKKDTFRAIVDFKSGRKGFYEEHEMQLHLYRLMWNENYPNDTVERVFNFSPKDWRTSPTYNLKEQTGSDTVQMLPSIIELARMKDAARNNTMTIVSGKIDLDKGFKASENVSSVSLADVVLARRYNAEISDVIEQKQANKPETAPAQENTQPAGKAPENGPKNVNNELFNEVEF